MFNNLLSKEMVSEIAKALNAGKDFNYSKDGLTINCNKNNGVFSVSCNYKPVTKDTPVKDQATELREAFYEWVREIDEDLFLEICDHIDTKTIDAQIKSSDLKEIVNGIYQFKNAYKEILTAKQITLRKRVESLSTELENATELLDSINEALSE